MDWEKKKFIHLTFASIPDFFFLSYTLIKTKTVKKKKTGINCNGNLNDSDKTVVDKLSNKFIATVVKIEGYRLTFFFLRKKTKKS